MPYKNKSDEAKNHHRYYLEHKEERTEYNRRWNAENKEKRAAMCKSWVERNRDKTREAGRKCARNQREKVIEFYGNVCACCGEENEMFLSIDHINGNGRKHRKEIGSNAIYRWLIRNKFPDGYRVLCMNCNWGRERNGGICPHIVQSATKSEGAA